MNLMNPTQRRCHFLYEFFFNPYINFECTNQGKMGSNWPHHSLKTTVAAQLYSQHWIYKSRSTVDTPMSNKCQYAKINVLPTAHAITNRRPKD